MATQPSYNHKIALKAAGLYFAAVFGAGVALGALRVLWIAPEVGSRAAELIEMPLMLAVMILASRWVVRRFSLPSRASVRLGVGFIALVLLLIVEFAIVLRVRGTSMQDYWNNLDRVSGSVYYALLGLYALLPALVKGKRWYTSHATAMGVFALLAVIAAPMYMTYTADVESARKRVAVGSEIAQTLCGPIEYAVTGSGSAVLLVHGAGGGFDQSLEFGAVLAQQGFQVIAVSRFGYLRTPLPVDASPQAQADAHACLLDALKVERAAIVGVSAGGPSTMQFALRHPQRTSAMVLLVPLAYVPRATPAPQPSLLARFMYERAVKSDFLYWLALRIAPGVVVKTILATPPEVLAKASSEERARAARLMEIILPLSRRQAGLLNDAAVAASLVPYELERIGTRTLVISVADDLYGTYESAGYTASRIPGARFIGYTSGGHVWAGHNSAVLYELSAFLSSANPPALHADE